MKTPLGLPAKALPPISFQFRLSTNKTGDASSLEDVELLWLHNNNPTGAGYNLAPNLIASCVCVLVSLCGIYLSWTFFMSVTSW